MGHKILRLCLGVLLLLTCLFTVSAEEFMPEERGSITVTLTEQKGKTPIVDAELSLYYIATVKLNDTGNLGYSYREDFSHCGIALDDPALASKLEAFLSDGHVQAVKLRTDAEGTVVCRDLPLGLYFLCQTGLVEGYAPCTPFLVTLPVKTAEGYEYHVNATPKTEVSKLKDITVKKVWNVGASTEATQSISVQLLRNGVVVETAVLNEENDWQMTYRDLPESDAYSIKELNVPKGFTATYGRNGSVFTVTNTWSLVDTGQLQWPIPVLAICGILLIWLGVELLQKKRESNA